MTGLLFAPALAPGALAWLVAMLAAATGIALHLACPPRDPAITEALLHAAVHP